MIEPRVDRRLVGEHAETLAAQEAETAMDENLEAGLDACHRGRV